MRTLAAMAFAGVVGPAVAFVFFTLYELTVTDAGSPSASTRSPGVLEFIIEFAIPASLMGLVMLLGVRRYARHSAGSLRRSACAAIGALAAAVVVGVPLIAILGLTGGSGRDLLILPAIAVASGAIVGLTCPKGWLTPAKTRSAGAG